MKMVRWELHIETKLLEIHLKIYLQINEKYMGDLWILVLAL